MATIGRRLLQKQADLQAEVEAWAREQGFLHGGRSIEVLVRLSPILSITHSLSELGLSPATLSSLNDGGYRTIGDVLAESEGQLLRIPRFGPVRLRELKEALAQVGLPYENPPQ